MSQVEYDFQYAARQLRRSRHPLRRVVKQFYLSEIVKDVLGPAIDFGCGAGQLLELLPAKSVGLEINPFLVQALREKGLNARHYNPDIDKLSFGELTENHFSTLIMSHVLEHFDDAADQLQCILNSCRRLGVRRVIVVVPGKKGYSYDSTHKTFIDRSYLEEHKLFHCCNYSIIKYGYFPMDWERLGDIFTFHEFKFIYDKN